MENHYHVKKSSVLSKTSLNRGSISITLLILLLFISLLSNVYFVSKWQRVDNQCRTEQKLLSHERDNALQEKSDAERQLAALQSSYEKANTELETARQATDSKIECKQEIQDEINYRQVMEDKLAASQDAYKLLNAQLQTVKDERDKAIKEKNLAEKALKQQRREVQFQLEEKDNTVIKDSDKQDSQEQENDTSKNRQSPTKPTPSPKEETTDSKKNCPRKIINDYGECAIELCNGEHNPC